VKTLSQLQKEQQRIANLLGKGKFLKAKEQCNKALKQNPGEVNLYNLSAIILFKLQRNEEAISFLKKGLELSVTDKQRATLYNSLGQIIRPVDLDKALVYHKKAVELDPLAEHLSTLALVD